MTAYALSQFGGEKRIECFAHVGYSRKASRSGVFFSVANHVNFTALSHFDDSGKRSSESNFVGNLQLIQHTFGNFDAGTLKCLAVVPLQGWIGWVRTDDHTA